MKEGRFSFERGRGVVWVCDVESSSKHLNDDKSVSAMEEFLPRLHWLGKVAVSAAGGCFLKWTGDGFLAWFPIALHRELASKSPDVIEAIWHLTVMNNVTGLGVTERTRFHLRHGVTVEHDALITKISEEHGESIDLIGRSVVLAFRLAGIRAGFPKHRGSKGSGRFRCCGCDLEREFQAAPFVEGRSDKVLQRPAVRHA